MKYLLLALSISIYFVIQAQPATRSIAIVELFTSQGCSSCPSADRLLKEAVNAKNADGEVYGLSFHVNYWNRLGWKDPYSSDQFTARQKRYAQKMRLGRIYTPQMIVDGKDEFVGSQKNLLLKSLKSSFLSNKKSEITITNLEQKGSEIMVTYVCQNGSSEDVINIAVVQTLASNHIPRGENKNKTLVHSNVVRAFVSVPLRAKGQVSVELPVRSNESEYEVIAYTQHNQSLEITSAGKTQLQ